jgi:hypothetical protein
MGQWETSGRSCRSSMWSFETPLPPPPLQPNRRLSRPGAYPVQGIDARPHGEEEKQEESSCISSVSCRSADEFLLEATLVSDKSLRSTVREIVRAEPVRRFTARVVCSRLALLLVIAFFAAAGGMAWGLRQQGADVLAANDRTRTASPIMNATIHAASKPAAIATNATESMRSPSGGEFTVAAGFSSSLLNGLSPPTTNASSPTIIVPFNRQTSKDFVIGLLPDMTKASLLDPNSPQSYAFQWLMQDPRLAKYKVDQILQRLALATLYYSANGEHWEADDDTWLSFEDECSWYSDALDGFLCNEGQYKVLSMNQLPMNGTLPDEVWLLSSLVSVQLFKHHLVGTIPTLIGKMLPLESLLLYQLSLEGTIPSQIGLPNLNSLNLGGNSFTGGIPTEISKAGKLTQLYLNDNRLSGPLHESLGQLGELKELVLHNNSMTSTIPGSLGNLSSLRLAYLSMNSFTGTIPELSALSFVI